MPITIERLKAADFEAFQDFIDLVFSQHSHPHHFYVDLPLLFAPTDEMMQSQYAVRENGHIRAAIGAIPYEYQVGSETFTTKTITNVATHHLHTGKGYMQMLMNRVIADMKQDETDFATLHGNRERYRFFGFESAGVTSQALITRENVANRIKLGEKTPYHLELLADSDLPRIRQCLDLFNREPEHYMRPETTFMQTMHMWHANAWLILNEQGDFCGYLNLSDDRSHIQELLLNDSRTVSEVLSSLILQLGLERVILSLSPFDKVMMREAYRIAEGVGSNLMCRVSIYRLERLLAACLNAKRQCCPELPDGEFVLESPFGRHLICNRQGFTVTLTDRQPDLSLSGPDCYSLLFGPSEYVIPLDKAALGSLGAWFPAPLFIHHVDRY